MTLLFSEATPDTGHYTYPYVVWGFPERGESPADFLQAGFLPSSVNLDRFYLCRQLRLPLKAWKPSSENRRVLRKGERYSCTLVPRRDFDYSPGRRGSWLRYAAARFGPGVMPEERLDRLMGAPVVSHLLHFTDSANDTDVGTVLLYLEPPRVAFYYYAFYELDLAPLGVGMHLMTRAAMQFADAGYAHLHLGTCYHRRALYKTQFSGIEFFNGFRWSSNLAELRHLIDTPGDGRHRLETPAFVSLQPEPLAVLATQGGFRGPRRDPHTPSPSA